MSLLLPWHSEKTPFQPQKGTMEYLHKSRTDHAGATYCPPIPLHQEAVLLPSSRPQTPTQIKSFEPQISNRQSSEQPGVYFWSRGHVVTSWSTCSAFLRPSLGRPENVVFNAERPNMMGAITEPPRPTRSAGLSRRSRPELVGGSFERNERWCNARGRTVVA